MNRLNSVFFSSSEMEPVSVAGDGGATVDLVVLVLLMALLPEDGLPRLAALLLLNIFDFTKSP